MTAQPPSGGCVLKHRYHAQPQPKPYPQPPSGGCVLKQPGAVCAGGVCAQPPSGGCVLKRLFPLRRLMA